MDSKSERKLLEATAYLIDASLATEVAPSGPVWDQFTAWMYGQQWDRHLFDYWSAAQIGKAFRFAYLKEGPPALPSTEELLRLCLYFENRDFHFSYDGSNVDYRYYLDLIRQLLSLDGLKLGQGAFRRALVQRALIWEQEFGVAPAVTSAVSEYDAAMLVGMSEEAYSEYMQGRTAVAKGLDFEYEGVRYQVKGNRPSGKPGSKVTWVPKATNYDWDQLIWVLYNPDFEIMEAWAWEVESYRDSFDHVKRLSPADYRAGRDLLFR